MESSAEYLRQHQPVTVNDRIAEGPPKAIHIGDAPPAACHVIDVHSSETSNSTKTTESREQAGEAPKFLGLNTSYLTLAAKQRLTEYHPSPVLLKPTFRRVPTGRHDVFGGKLRAETRKAWNSCSSEHLLV